MRIKQKFRLLILLEKFDHCCFWRTPVPWASNRVNVAFARDNWRLSVKRCARKLRIPVWPKSDTNKQIDGIGLTQTRSRVFRGLGNDPEHDISIAGWTMLGIVFHVHTRSGTAV
jgi:hypothetical protein